MKGKIWLIVMLALAIPALVSAQDSVQTGTSTTTTVRTSTSTASGNQSGERIGFGPIIGWTKASNGDAVKLTGGAALRMKFGEVFGLEGAISYREDKFNNGAVTARSWPIQVTGLFYLVPVVYGAVGAGWYHSTFDYDLGKYPAGTESETKTNFGWHFGGGLEIPAGRASLVADIRYVFLNYDFKQLPGVGSENSNFYTVTVGLLFGL